MVRSHLRTRLLVGVGIVALLLIVYLPWNPVSAWLLQLAASPHGARLSGLIAGGILLIVFLPVFLIQGWLSRRRLVQLRRHLQDYGSAPHLDQLSAETHAAFIEAARKVSANPQGIEAIIEDMRGSVAEPDASTLAQLLRVTAAASQGMDPRKAVERYIVRPADDAGGTTR